DSGIKDCGQLACIGHTPAPTVSYANAIWIVAGREQGATRSVGAAMCRIVVKYVAVSVLYCRRGADRRGQRRGRRRQGRSVDLSKRISDGTRSHPFAAIRGNKSSRSRGRAAISTETAPVEIGAPVSKIDCGAAADVDRGACIRIHLNALGWATDNFDRWSPLYV